MTETQLKLIFSRAIGIALLIFCVLGTYSAPMAANKIYVVQNISVDETASSASAARTIAVKKGQKRAFNALLRRLVPVPYHTNLPVLDNAAVTPLVASFQVSNERTSSKRYLADLTFEFKRDDIRKLLRTNFLPFSESMGKTILILPVFLQDDTAYLWEYPNPWRTIWVDIIDYGMRPQEPDSLRDDWAQTLLQPVIVPSGDLEDIKVINVNQAVGLNREALETLQKAYGAAEVQVISATMRIDTDGTLLVDITQDTLGQQAPAIVQTYKGSDDADGLMQSVVFDLLARMQEDWKQKNVLDFSVENTLAVTTKISNLADWVSIQNKVDSLSAVNATKVKDLSVNRAFWHVTYVGSVDQLIAALDQQDLTLIDQGGYWTLDLK